MITKSETRTVFDRSKIGVGDIVEYSRDKWAYVNLFRLKKSRQNVRMCGIVAEVEPDCLWIIGRNEFSPSVKVDRFGLGVERADEIKLIRRNPLNEVNAN